MKEAAVLAVVIPIALRNGYAGELWAAWSVLAAYGAPVLVLVCVVGWKVAQRHLAKERQALAEREAAADAQVQEARHTMAKARGIKQTAQDEVQAAMEQVARREQEAAAQVEKANDRLQGSVDTNIGRRKLIQKLRKQVNELKEQATMGHCQKTPS